MRKISFAIFLLILIFLCSSSISAATLFYDVAGHWGEGNIYTAAEADIVHGYPDKTFQPNGKITRAEFVTIFAHESGEDMNDYKDPSGNFSDVPQDHWAYSYILWGKENSILTGYGDNTFRPDQSISRQEMASVLYRYITLYYQKDILAITPEIVFADENQIASWALDAVKAMQRSGIINGKGNNIFDPLSDATRAETTVMLNRFITYYQTDSLTLETTADIYINKQLAQGDISIKKQNNTYMIPIRSLLEPTGFEINYYGEAGLIVAYRHDRDLEFWINKTMYYNNGAQGNLTTAPALINGTAYIPIQEIATASGMICQIKKQDQNVNIYLTGGVSPITKTNHNFYGVQNSSTGTAFLGADHIGFWGTLTKGQMDYGSYLMSNGELLFGYWQNGTLNGSGRSVNRYGEFYVGTFANSIKQSGTLYFTNGSKYIGTFKKNSYNVTLPDTGQYITANGTVYGNANTQWSTGSLSKSKW